MRVYKGELTIVNTKSEVAMVGGGLPAGTGLGEEVKSTNRKQNGGLVNSLAVRGDVEHKYMGQNGKNE